MKGLSHHEQIETVLRTPANHQSPVHTSSHSVSPQRELANHQQRSQHTYPHSPAPGQADTYRISQFEWDVGSSGEERNADHWCGSCGEGSYRPAHSDTPPTPRPSYSHFVRQPRVRRQCNLKGNLRPVEESGRVKVGQRDGGLGRVESKHLHGAAGLDTNLTPTPSTNLTSSAASGPTQVHVSRGKLGSSKVAGVQGTAWNIGPRCSRWAAPTSYR